MLSSKQFQSTLPMRGATHTAQRSGGDMDNFNPHSPCGERHNTLMMVMAEKIFQSTLPMRGATEDVQEELARLMDFNPHSPCGERPRR